MLVCLRSTWDYHLRARAFHAWVSAFRSTPGRLWNPPATVRWNLDKKYLRGLGAAGIAKPGSIWTEPGQSIDLQEMFARTGWERAVVKPRISASAFGTLLVTRSTRLAPVDRAPLESSGALFQEFLPQIQTRGEVSLVFLDGAFSHAARKRVGSGEFRVQPHLGGTARAHAPGESLVAFGVQVLARVPEPWLYARVDVVEAERGSLLMEAELIEPELFLTMAESRGVDRFAAALERRLDEPVHARRASGDVTPCG